MSRVDEALRRAQQETTAPSGVDEAQVATPVLDMDVNALAAEPFPIEMREHRRARREGAAAPPASEARPQPMPVKQDANLTAAGDVVQQVGSALAEKIVVDQHMSGVSREQYRRLAGILHHGQLNNGLSIVMVTSAVPGEGKTLTSSNLALTFSESYQRNVLLIDADLRRPTLHTIFNIDNSTGLSDGLSAATEKPMAIRRLSQRLSILPAGKPTSDPMAGLTSERMLKLLREARGAFDWVIIDTPPVALLPDANLLTSMADGALLVIKASSTPHHLVKRAADALGRDRMLGVVLNRSTMSTHGGSYGYYSNYYYYYGGAPSETPAET